MASEIRVNKINNRAGLGTVEYTPTGIIVSGIVTAYEFDGNFDTTPGIVITGIGTAQSLDVDDFVDVGSNIKLGNAGVVTATTFSTANVDINTDKIVVGTGVTIEANQVATGQATFTGIVTASSFRGDGSQLTGITGTTINNNTANRIITGEGGTTLNGEANFTFDGTNLVLAEGVEFKMGTSSNFELISINGNKVRMQAQQTNFHIETSNNNSIVLRTNRNGSYNGIIIDGSGDVKPNADSTVDLGSNSVRFANIYADTYYGDGANLTNLPASAPVGGASTNTVFFENDKAVAVNYQITSTKNAMSAGPIAINAGIAVTVPSGCSWTIV